MCDSKLLNTCLTKERKQDNKPFQPCKDLNLVPWNKSKCATNEVKHFTHMSVNHIRFFMEFKKCQEIVKMSRLNNFMVHLKSNHF